MTRYRPGGGRLMRAWKLPPGAATVFDETSRRPRYRSIVTRGPAGLTVPLTTRGADDRSDNVKTGATASTTTSDTPAGAGRCSARSSVLEGGVTEKLQAPSASVIRVAIVVSMSVPVS